MTLREALLLIVAPLVTSLVVGVLIAAPGRGSRADLYARAWALALGAGAAAGVLGAFGLDALWPKRAEHWLLWIALASAVAGAVDALPACRWWVRWPMRLGVCAAALAVVLRPIIDGDGSTAQTVAWLSCLMLATAAMWSGLAATGGGGAGDAPRSWILWLVTLAVAAMQLFAGSSMVLAQLALSLASALLPLVLIAWWTRQWSGATGVAAPWTTLIAAMLLMGTCYGDLQPADATLVALAALPAWPTFGHRPAWRMAAPARFLFAALLVGTPLVYRAIAYFRQSHDIMGF